jgi:sodium-dependent dicarboxylate transporter 2/3/5
MGRNHVRRVVINFLLTPLAATAAFTPAFGELGTAMNVNPLPLFYAFNFGLDQYIFPYEAVYFLYIFITERVLLRHIVTALAIRMLIVGIFVVVVAVPYWNGIGLM